MKSKLQHLSFRYRNIRKADRSLNQDQYPKLNFPEMYLIHNGYKSFFESQKVISELIENILWALFNWIFNSFTKKTHPFIKQNLIFNRFSVNQRTTNRCFTKRMLRIYVISVPNLSLSPPEKRGRRLLVFHFRNIFLVFLHFVLIFKSLFIGVDDSVVI